MKYKVGDRVKIQSIARYNKYKNRSGDINYGCETEILFTSEMSSFCGQVVTITRVRYIGSVRFYHLAEDNGVHLWVAGMFEGLVEPFDCKKCGLTRMSTRCLFMDNCPHNQPKHTIEIPKDWILKDGKGNVINATEIVLEKKKKEYPKTYEECCKVLSLGEDGRLYTKGYKASLIQSFQKLFICRDAYWKLYGEEMGLGKPWEPDYTDPDQDRYAIVNFMGNIEKIKWDYAYSTTFIFPTPEMRDAFKENFDPDIEFCKEFL